MKIPQDFFMKNTWIVIANGITAKIFHQKKKGDQIIAIQTFSHPRTAKKEAATNNPEETPLRHTIDYNKEFEEHERLAFAREITSFLTQALNQQRFDNLILAASPDLIGHLRNEFSTELRRRVLHEMVKDLLSQHFSDAILVEKINDSYREE